MHTGPGLHAFTQGTGEVRLVVWVWACVCVCVCRHVVWVCVWGGVGWGCMRVCGKGVRGLGARVSRARVRTCVCVLGGRVCV